MSPLTLVACGSLLAVLLPSLCEGQALWPQTILDGQFLLNGSGSSGDEYQFSLSPYNVLVQTELTDRLRTFAIGYYDASVLTPSLSCSAGLSLLTGQSYPGGDPDIGCPRQGPRTASLVFQCASAAALLSVVEAPTCAYTMTFTLDCSVNPWQPGTLCVGSEQPPTPPAVVVDNFNNDDGGSFTSSVLSTWSSPFTIRANGWIAGQYSVKTGGPPGSGLSTYLSQDYNSGAMPGSESSIAPGGPATVSWRRASLSTPFPVAGGRGINVFVGSTDWATTFSAGVVGNSCPTPCYAIANFSVTERANTTTASDDYFTTPIIATSYGFSSTALTVPADGYISSYSVIVSPWTGGPIKAYFFPAGTNDELYSRWMYTGADTSVRVHTVGLAREEWIPVAGGEQFVVTHT